MRQRITLVLVSLLVCASCAGTSPAPCISNVNKLIIQFGRVELVPRDTCGSFGAFEDLGRPTQCFQDAVASRRSAELIVNRGIDAVYVFHYVWLPDAGLYRMHVKDDTYYGPDPRMVVLDRCEGSALECNAPQRLYTCEERPTPRRKLPI